MRPNLFKHATKELSQDALICYLLDFYRGKNDYEIKNREECELAENFIKLILKKIGLEDLKIEKIDFKKQYMSIDVLIIINDELYIIIEDKTFTSQGKNQMNGYRNKIIDKHEMATQENVYCIYYKTGDESFHSLDIIKNEDKTFIFLRDEIIQMLKSYNGNNIIFNDYLINLEDMKNERENYINRNLYKEKLAWVEIIGFYNALDEEFKKLKSEKIMPEEINFSWEYTPNPNGGFMCYYFMNVLNYEKYGYYLQLECTDNGSYDEETDEEKIGKESQENLKLVVKVWNDEKNINILYESFKIFERQWKEKIDYRRPTRFSKGTWMTQLIINNYLQLKENGKMDVRKTAERIVVLLKELRKLDEELKKIF